MIQLPGSNLIMAKTTTSTSKATRYKVWVLARKITQYVMLVVFLLFFLFSRRDGGWSPTLVNLPFRLDPLTMLANLLSSRTFLAGSAVALITIVLTLVFGRAWCGWICPLGTTLDLFPLKKARGKRPAPKEGWRKVKYLLLKATLAAALLGNLSLLVFDPLTILYRTLTVSILPGLDRVILWAEQTLFRIPFLSSPVASFDAFIRPALLPVSPANFQAGLLFAVLFIAIIALNVFAERFWCRYLCPLGGLLGWISKIAFFRRVVDEKCTGCVLCTQRCPTGTIDPGRTYASDPEECTLCLDCLPACPHSRIDFNVKLPKPVWRTYDPGRREFLATFGLTAAAVVLTKPALLSGKEPPFLIRPPGMREANSDIFSLNKCIRCAECMRTCPTSAIQVGIWEPGLEGFGTPVLVPRLGYCDFSCNACGQVCPTAAIPALSLEEKRLQVIGKAYIDENRCIPYADATNCFVCEEMCPLPQKAITLVEKGKGEGKGMGSGGVQVPVVNRELCTGCGICEYQCPVTGDSSIRVYIPSTSSPG
jgi:polyferredoxin